MAHLQPPSKKARTIFAYFTREENEKSTHNDPSVLNVTTPVPDLQPFFEPQLTQQNEYGANHMNIERDPGLRVPIFEHPVNQRDEIRRAYIKAGPFQPKLSKYLVRYFATQGRRFQYIWFKQFPWLEYSLSNNKAYCFPCFVFETKTHSGIRSALVSEGFDSWNRVNCGKKCPFIVHVGSSCSIHNNCEKSILGLMRPSQHIDKVMNSQSKDEILKNRLRLQTTIRSVRFLAFQRCAFRGHDESSTSLNHGNFIESIKLQAEVNDDIAKVVLKNAPHNAQYIAPTIQKEILHILSCKVRTMIREEIGDAPFCILVDEALDESKKEQMEIILRFVNEDGILLERFFEIMSVKDTSSVTLKKKINDSLIRYNLNFQNMRGQGYDGASNMRGQWNGLQALFLRDCPYAYYVHCFAHRLQLALVAAAKDEDSIWRFFSNLNTIVNIVCSSAKRVSEFKSAQQDEIENMIASGERESGKGVNQIGTLHRAGATRWSSHYQSVRNLIDMYTASRTIIKDLRKNIGPNGPNANTRGEARGTYKVIKSFEFIFCLHLMDKIMGITDILCQALQQKSLDILNAMKLVSTTKTLMLKLRQEGWNVFLIKVDSFCMRHDIRTPDMSAPNKTGRNKDHITVEHHYHFDIFNSVIDFQLMELNNRFNEGAVELLSLSFALNPSDCFKSFNIDDICNLAGKYYPRDFTGQELHVLRCELEHYKVDVTSDPEFQKISSLCELCRQLVVTKKSNIYSNYRTSFSAMKQIKTALRNKMEDEFLGDCMTLYIERELAMKIDFDSVIDDFYTMKPRRVQLQ